MMEKLIIVLIGVGAILFCVALGIGTTWLAILGFVIFAVGVLCTRLPIRR